MIIINKNQLYVGVGDGGADAVPLANKWASCLNHPKGKILRMELDGSPAADNPLADMQSGGCGCATPGQPAALGLLPLSALALGFLLGVRRRSR